MNSGDGPSKSDYDVGYGKPPKAHRFQPGQSGNPLGRPKGARNKPPPLQMEPFKKIVALEAYREVAVRDGDEIVTMPMAQAVMRSVSVKAGKGNHRAQKHFTDVLGDVEAQSRKDHEDYVQAAYDYKKRTKAELERREREGVTDAPDILPHPDHVFINLNTMTVHYNGPCTERQKEFYDECFERFCKAFDLQLQLELLLNYDEELEDRDVCIAAIEHQKNLQKILKDEVGKGFGSEGMRRLFLQETIEYQVTARLNQSKKSAAAKAEGDPVEDPAQE